MRISTLAAVVGLCGTVIAMSPAATAGAAGTSGNAAGDPVVSVITNATSCAYFCFTPAQTTVAVGETVTFTNKTGTEHTVARCNPTACSGVAGGTGTDTTFNAANISLPPGKSVQHAFTQPGTYVYYCTIHGYALMHGTITVTAPATTVAPVTTAVSPTTGAAAPGPTTAPLPQLARTGSHAGGYFSLAGILILVGLTASSFRLRRRYSEHLDHY